MVLHPFYYEMEEKWISTKLNKLFCLGLSINKIEKLTFTNCCLTLNKFLCLNKIDKNKNF